jgi:hypothetical protein
VKATLQLLDKRAELECPRRQPRVTLPSSSRLILGAQGQSGQGISGQSKIQLLVAAGDLAAPGCRRGAGGGARALRGDGTVRCTRIDGTDAVRSGVADPAVFLIRRRDF